MSTSSLQQPSLGEVSIVCLFVLADDIMGSIPASEQSTTELTIKGLAARVFGMESLDKTHRVTLSEDLNEFLSSITVPENHIERRQDLQAYIHGTLTSSLSVSEWVETTYITS
jgi:hypothetical protein